jgi:hypothetical protein
MKVAHNLAERLCRPQRIGVFGHRGVGKTTLLTMLYREGVGGRLPGFRLAAADARTADYLSDKIRQLESGQPLPGTLAETDLRFHLYHQGARLELLFKDYQGEHVELGRDEPIRDFLRDCDAVWLCLDAGSVSDPATRLRREQEVEQLVEDYLATDVLPGLHRPMALVLTKADLLDAGGADGAADELAMTRHALASHCPQNGLFAVSSLGQQPAACGLATLQPRNLDAPLAWLVMALRAHDEARLEWLWSSAGRDLALLERCVGALARRYPESETIAQHAAKLKEQRRGRRRRRVVAGLAAAAALLFGLGTYDVMGRESARRFERENGHDPAAALAGWQEYQRRHPTRVLFQPDATGEEEAHLKGLAERVRKRECDARLAELRVKAADPDADPEAVWRLFLTFRADYPAVDVGGDLQQLRAAVKARRDVQVARKAQQAYDQIVSGEQDAELPELLAQADRFLREHAGSPQEAEVRRRRDAYLRRLEERDIEPARVYSAREPLNFQTRREHYQRYLDRHPAGAFREEAEYALKAIESDWDRHDFRAVRDHFVGRPADVQELVARCRTYLAVHPRGEFAEAAHELLRWSERVTEPQEYRVVLRGGSFEKGVARYLSRGPDLSVELEVAGVRYGPSNVVSNSYSPEWYYEFSRPVRWKLGDPVRIRVTDHDWKDRVVLEIASGDGDPLGMRLLAGEAASGNNRLTFESDFALPNLPQIE